MNESIKKAFRANSGFLETNSLRSRSAWRELRELSDNNRIVKVKRGLYRLNVANYNQQIEAAKMIPSGIFCLFTAWQYYKLSVYNPFEFYMAIRKKQKIVLPAYPPVKLHYWIDSFYLLGITEIIVDNQIIKIYDLEKSVCDAVRFRNKVGMDITSEILKNYLKRNDRDLNKLWQYACSLRIEKPMRDFVTVML